MQKPDHGHPEKPPKGLCVVVQRPDRVLNSVTGEELRNYFTYFKCLAMFSKTRKYEKVVSKRSCLHPSLPLSCIDNQFFIVSYVSLLTFYIYTSK